MQAELVGLTRSELEVVRAALQGKYANITESDIDEAIKGLGAESDLINLDDFIITGGASPSGEPYTIQELIEILKNIRTQYSSLEERYKKAENKIRRVKDLMREIGSRQGTDDGADDSADGADDSAEEQDASSSGTEQPVGAEEEGSGAEEEGAEESSSESSEDCDCDDSDNDEVIEVVCTESDAVRIGPKLTMKTDDETDVGSRWACNIM